MPTCIGIKKNLRRCENRSQEEGFCGMHVKVYRRNVANHGEHTLGKCWATQTNGWCQSDAVDGELVCATHAVQRNDILRRETETRFITTEVIRALDRAPPPTWQVFLDEVFEIHLYSQRERYMIARRFFILEVGAPRFRDFEIRYQWVANGRIGPEPVVLEYPLPPERYLAEIAKDGQNVHTAAVSNQTNSGTDKLLRTSVPVTQMTERQIATSWFALQRPPSHNAYLRVANDMNRWFLQNTCRMENDNLYRKLLRGVVATLERQEKDVRSELYIRLWQECHESVGLCCEGHISRLCNVFVGFDETFQTPVSVGELMQAKMSVISGLDIPVEERLKQARAWFDEHGISDAERVGWLDALSAM